MTTPDPDALRRLASECVRLTAADFGRNLDWSLESLAELDAVCASLLAEGPLPDKRLDLWWKLAGAYTGEVVVRAYAGEWISHENAPGAFAISALGLTAFPFTVAERVLSGEQFKSLASFGSALPAISEQLGDQDG